MNRLVLWLFSMFAIVSAGWSCGSANLAPPPYLEVVSILPDDGATSVGVAVEPIIHFSGEVDSASVTGSSFYLETTSREILDVECEPDRREPCDCEPWEEDTVPGLSVVDGLSLTFQPDGDLDDGTCYRFTLTTEVRGTELGPLEDMRWPASCRQKIGAQGFFCTPEP